jgi:hypothetical protein
LPAIERHYCAFEGAVKPLVDAANTDNWRHALNLLYINGSVMSFSQEVPLPALVGLEEAEQDVEMSMDLLQGKAKTALASLVSGLARLFVPKILSMLQKPEYVEAMRKDQQELTTALFASTIMPEVERSMSELTKIFVEAEGAFTISELIGISVFRDLCELRDRQIHAALAEDNYEEMVELLKNLNVIEPRLQVSVCPNCANYQFTISRYPPYSDECPKCGHMWTTATLYTLEPSLAKLKSENADLPVFASAYLRNKLAHEVPAWDIEIYPNAVVNVEGQKVEIDVYLPQFGIGLECKVFEDALAPMTRSRLGSIVGSVAQQVERLLATGIESVVVVTNLPGESARKLETELQKNIQQRGVKIKELKIVQGDVDVLIQTLDNLAGSIAKEVSVKLSKS